MSIVVNNIRVVRLLGNDINAGDDTQFLMLSSGAYDGWYGPVPPVFTPPVIAALAPSILGSDAADHKETYLRLRATAHGNDFSQQTARWVIGALDCALWDLHSHAAECPVARILNPAAERVVPLYTSWLAADITNLVESARIGSSPDHGFFLTKWSARRPLTSRKHDDTQNILTAVRDMVSATSRPLAFDGVGTWDTDTAWALADAATSEHVWWLEDLLPGSDVSSYRTIAAGRHIKLAVGERLESPDKAVSFLRSGAISVLTPDTVWLGGITPTVQVVQHARKAGIPIFLHGRSFQPALHLAAAFGDVIRGVEFRQQWEPRRQGRYQEPLLPSEGFIMLPDTPGLGTSPDLTTGNYSIRGR